MPVSERAPKCAGSISALPYPDRVPPAPNPDTTLHLVDSLTGEKRPFEPRDPDAVGLYWCGPTVYDDPHVGHGRSALAFDVLVRYLRWSGYGVVPVRNITDIDDKIIARAAREGSSEPEVAGTFTDAYLREMDRLGIVRPDEAPHATQYVDRMVDVIRELIDRGMAYVIDGSGVYFDVSALPDYGTLVHRSAAELREGAGARVEVDDRKADPLDFALWKAAKPGEPTWDSPWGPGRPGWHIECVAMSLHLLGDGFDIHGGGDDLVFPHHENERAEAVGAGHEFARYWVHNGMVQVGGEKMSKSLGNFTTLAGILDAYDPRALRLLVLQTHYRKTMEINDAAMTQASRAVERLDAVVRKAAAAGVVADSAAIDAAHVAAFRSAMDDDLATPAAVAVIFDVVRAANTALDAGDPTAGGLIATLQDLAGGLGLDLTGASAATDQTAASDADEIDALVGARDAARAAKDWVEADRIRDALTARGIVIEDTPAGATWHRA